MKLHKLVLLFGVLLLVISTSAQVDNLKERIDSVVVDSNAEVGIAIIANDGNDTLTINGNSHFPMQSVFKFPIALAVLSQVDKGNLSLDQEIVITQEDLLPYTWSPIREKYPDGSILTLAEIMQYTVSQSDNNGCDILLRILGGPEIVENFLRDHNFIDISIKINEAQMSQAWEEQFKNWSTPLEMTNLLKYAYENRNNFLSNESYNSIWKIMKETTTGPGKLKGQLPEGTIVAHKTGGSGTNDKGITAASNDVGVILLPDGKPIFISVFITNSSETSETNDKIISDIAKLTWDYYTEK